MPDTKPTPIAKEQLHGDAQDCLSTEGQLCDALQVFCDHHNLPHISADEIAHMDLTGEQQAWIDQFIIRWDQVVDCEH